MGIHLEKHTKTWQVRLWILTSSEREQEDLHTRGELCKLQVKNEKLIWNGTNNLVQDKKWKDQVERFVKNVNTCAGIAVLPVKWIASLDTSAKCPAQKGDRMKNML